jgi:hypothetical protein
VEAVGLDVLALETVGAGHPQVAIGHGHAFQVGFFVGGARQVQQIGQRKVAHLAEAQGFAADGIESAQAVQATGFVAGDPEPVAGEGRARQVGLDQGAGCEFEADGVGAAGVGHGGTALYKRGWRAAGE